MAPDQVAGGRARAAAGGTRRAGAVPAAARACQAPGSHASRRDGHARRRHPDAHHRRASPTPGTGPRVVTFMVPKPDQLDLLDRAERSAEGFARNGQRFPAGSDRMMRPDTVGRSKGGTVRGWRVAAVGMTI